MKANSEIRNPALVIGYLRLERIERILEHLASLDFGQVFLALDCAKNERDKNRQLKFLEEAIHKFDSINLRIWHRKENLGVALGVLTAIEWFFQNVNQGVIIEDDIIFEEDFIEFTKLCFDEYFTESTVLMVSGTNGTKIGTQFPVFVRYPQIWGWATNEEKWREILSLILREKKFKPSLFVSPSKAFFWAGARRASDGTVDTWDLPLAYEMKSCGKLCVIPGANLVKNVGNDQFASHGTEDGFTLNQQIENWHPVDNYRTKVGYSSRHEKALERVVFNVHWYHIFSPIKYFLLFWKGRNTSAESLKKRFESVEIPQ